MSNEALCAYCGHVMGHWVGGTGANRRFRPSYPLKVCSVLSLFCPSCGEEIIHHTDLTTHHDRKRKAGTSSNRQTG